MALTLTSANFKEGATLGMEHVLSAEYGFGTSGGNKSPQLSWSGAPAGTKTGRRARHAPAARSCWAGAPLIAPAMAIKVRDSEGNRTKFEPFVTTGHDCTNLDATTVHRARGAA